MDALERMVFVGAICLAPIAGVGLILRRKRAARKSNTQAPFPELRRRPAGEGLRLKMAEIDEKVSEWIAPMVGVPAMVAYAAYMTPAWLSLIGPILISVLSTGFCGFKLYRLFSDYENKQLGFAGERFVGEELTRLILHGYEVYHDIPFDNFNADHVLVGPAGVFAVETKTRRKPIYESKGKQFKVKFDGSKLHWPWGPETSEVDQALLGARDLAKFLSAGVGCPVRVSPILTIPGWWVHVEVPEPRPLVLNPDQIFGHISQLEKSLDLRLQKQICHQLDLKCRVKID